MGLKIILINLAISALVHFNVSSLMEGSLVVLDKVESPEELVEELYQIISVSIFKVCT